MKRFISFVVVLSFITCLFSELGMSVFASEEESQAELIDIDIYKAQCFLGIAEDQKTNAVEHCANLYNYYVNEEVFSPTQTFLDEAYADTVLMMNFDEWKLYSLGADVSSALEQPLAKKDYYESLIIALFSQSLNENGDTIRDVKVRAAATATQVTDNLCAVAGVTTKASLISYFSNTTTSTMKSAIQGASAERKLPLVH